MDSSLFTFCSLPVLIIFLFIFTALVHYLRQVDIVFISPGRMTLIYVLMLVPFLTFLILSILLDLLRCFVFTLKVPWIKILTVEDLGMSLVLYDLLSVRKAHCLVLSISLSTSS